MSASSRRNSYRAGPTPAYRALRTLAAFAVVVTLLVTYLPVLASYLTTGLIA